MGTKLKNCHFSRNNGENCSNFCSEKIEAHFLHVLDINSPSIYVICPRKCQKPYNFDIFFHFPKFTPLTLLNSGMNPKLDQVDLCVYY